MGTFSPTNFSNFHNKINIELEIIMIKSNIIHHKSKLEFYKKRNRTDDNIKIKIHKNLILDYKKELKELTGDDKKIKLRWELRKEKRKLQELYKDEQVNRSSVSKKRL